MFTNFLDAMIAQVGFYGEFVLTCAGQDSMQTTDIKEQIRDNFVNTVLAIDNKKSSGITGYPNYCCITGTILQADTTSIGAKTYMHVDGNEYTPSDGFDMSLGYGYGDDRIADYNRTVNIIKSTPCHDLNGSAADPLNPFFAFDRVSLPP